MAQLIQLRQRMKAIETIKKITHAMRLIAMSSHSRLKNKQEPLQAFQQQLMQVINTLGAHSLETHPLFTPSPRAHKSLIVLVGSQKGLCGNFNSALFQFFKKNKQQYKNADLIIIGHKLAQYLLSDFPTSVIYSQLSFGINDLDDITNTIISYFIDENQYTSVVIMSNKPKTFFIQKPSITTVIPFKAPATQHTELKEEYSIEPSLPVVLKTALEFYLATKIRTVLYESLLAEQAARFLSMDQATRNATTLLEETTLQYNKLRQAKITQELTELSATF